MHIWELSIEKSTDNKGLTIHDIIHSFIEEEAEEFGVLQLNLGKLDKEIRKSFFETGPEDFLEPWPPVSSELAEMGTWYFLNPDDFESQVIYVRDYKTIPKLAGVPQNLIDKHVDMGASCSFSQGVKSFLLLCFCGIL